MPARLGERHLRRAMDRQLRGQAANQPDQAQVLHDHRIGPGCDDRRKQFRRLGQLVGKDQRVEGDVAAHIAAVQITRSLAAVLRRRNSRPDGGR